jgi:hypothetical protein
MSQPKENSLVRLETADATEIVPLERSAFLTPPPIEGGVIRNLFVRGRLTSQNKTLEQHITHVGLKNKLLEGYNQLSEGILKSFELDKQIRYFHVDYEAKRQLQQAQAERSEAIAVRQHDLDCRRIDVEATRAEADILEQFKRIEEASRPPTPKPRPKTRLEQLTDERDQIRARARRRRLESRELEECIAELTRDFENLKRDYPEQAERIDADLQREIEVLLENGFEAAQRR